MRPELPTQAPEWRNCGFGRPNLSPEQDEQLISSGLD